MHALLCIIIALALTAPVNADPHASAMAAATEKYGDGEPPWRIFKAAILAAEQETSDKNTILSAALAALESVIEKANAALDDAKATSASHRQKIVAARKAHKEAAQAYEPFFNESVEAIFATKSADEIWKIYLAMQAESKKVSAKLDALLAAEKAHEDAVKAAKDAYEYAKKIARFTACDRHSIRSKSPIGVLYCAALGKIE